MTNEEMLAYIQAAMPGANLAEMYAAVTEALLSVCAAELTALNVAIAERRWADASAACDAVAASLGENHPHVVGARVYIEMSR
jgi:hypothetical protein